MRSATAVRGLGSVVVLFALSTWVASTALAQPSGPAPAPKPDEKPAAPAGDQPPADPAGDTGDTAAPAPTPDPAAVEDMPVNLRLRQLEQRVQALKERAWRAKARVGMLKEAVLGGGVGSSLAIVHKNNMGSSFRLLKLVYALDGTQIFTRADDSGAMHGQKTIDIVTAPVAPGSHTISVYAVYRGHGYGVFKYLNKYRFKVRSSHTFTSSEGKATRIEVVGFEKGGATTPLEKRPAIDFKVTHGQGVSE